MSPVLKSIEHVIESSKFVSINEESVRRFSEKFSKNDLKHWMTEAPFDLSSLSDSDKLAFLFVFNTNSFCYWGEPKWTIDYKGEQLDGSWAMIASMGRAIEERIPILDLSYLANITEEELEHILRGNTTIPLFNERLSFLKELGSIVIQRYNGKFENVVESAQGDATELLKTIVKDFKSFRDEWQYNDKLVELYKRAQLLVSDIYHLFNGQGFGDLKGIDQITACADYKLPQVLRKFGVLQYAEDLSARIDRKILIPKGSEEEIEIRANTIQAVELIKNEVQKRIPDIKAVDINDYLWLTSQNKSPDDKPYHLTLTTAY